MTLPIQEQIAINNTLKFLYELTDPFKTPNLPLELRTKAKICLKQLPTPSRLDEIYNVDSYHKIPRRY